MPKKSKRSQAAKVRWSKSGEFPLKTQAEHVQNCDPDSNREVHFPDHSHANVTCVLASYSQSHHRYIDSKNSQCTCNSVTFLAFLHELHHLQSADLDQILDRGHAMYALTLGQLCVDGTMVHGHLNIQELPEIVFGQRQQHVLTKCNSMYGTFVSSPEVGEYLNLAARLQCLTSDVNSALLVMTSQCIAVFRDRHGRYGYFDPHSRRPDGFPSGPNVPGTAVMLTFTHLNDLVKKLIASFTMLGSSPYAPYELVPVLFNSEDEFSLDGVLANVDSNADTAECTPCDEISDAIELMHVCSGEVTVECDTSDKPQQMPNLSKYSKGKRVKFEKRLKASEVTKAKHSKNVETAKQKKYRKERERYAKDKYVDKKRSCETNSYRKKKMSYIATRYQRDSNYKQRQRSYIRNRYRQDKSFNQRQRSNIRNRYWQDKSFNQRRRSYIRNRYRQDKSFNQRQRSYTNTRYRLNAHFRQTRKSYITNRYANDPAFRSKQKETMRRRMRDKYSNNHSFGMTYNMYCAMKIRQKYRNVIRRPNQVDDSRPNQMDNNVIRDAIEVFRSNIKNGPTFACTVCHRALFANQVRYCDRSKYTQNTDVVETCLTGKFVHVCNDSCENPEQCNVPNERKREWICHCCHEHLKNGRMPQLAIANNLQLADIPPELCDLNILERHLISKYITFAKIIPLPKGQQRAIHGNVICVPSEVQETVNALPRLRSESQVLRVKLKRRLCYKGHQLFQTVTWTKLVRALLKLKEVHPQYNDITIRDEAELCDPTLDEDEDTENIDDTDFNAEDMMEIDSFENGALCEAEPENNEQAIDSIELSQQSNSNQQEGDEPNGGIALESCLQPTDISEEILSFSEGIYSVAPAEGNKPVSFFKTPNLEAMAFPVQFPTSKNTIDEERPKKLTPCSYFKSRLSCIDDRFARDTNYLFFAQFVQEIYQATSSMSIQLRKGKPYTRDGRKINNAMLQDKHEVEKLVRNKDAIRFMKVLRGSPAYWQQTTKDLFAMIRQCGTPTFFCTFSAAEMRWKEIITAIKTQQGEQVNFDELDWSSKCDILRSNPVTTMRMFDKRVEALFRDLIMSPAQPIGKVVDYFYRLEFQHRGSPHIHCLIWIEGAPVFEEDSDKTVCDFISKYITAEMPDPNTQPELHKKVSGVQMHSKTHSKTCIKYLGANCRFGFPKLPSPETMIVRSEECDGEDERTSVATRKLTALNRLLNNPESESLSLEQILSLCDLTVDQYQDCLRVKAKKSEVVLKRDPKEAYVNGYNPTLLLAWDANMDIQYILNPYSCIAYICSYISKAEHGLSEYLKTMIENSNHENLNESDEMKQVMQAYSKKREVSAQECVARACSLNMKRCSRSVIFVQTDDNPLKMSYPMSHLENKTPDSVNVWMTGLPDKYKSRPESPEFESMCLADFAATCRIVYGKQAQGAKAIPLLNEMGFVQKRTKDKPAVIKYYHVSQEKKPEQFHGTLLKLYLPYRSETQLKSINFPTYKSFHDHAGVQLPGSEYAELVSDIVKRNREKYEKHREDIDSAIAEYEQNGCIRNEWCNLAPECELQRLECIEELDARPADEDNVQENVPDYNLRSENRPEGAIMSEAPEMDPTVLKEMYRSLNQKQASVFYAVRDWCIKRVCGSNEERFFYYINGGAGTGKSHLIKCIHAEGSKILSRLPRNAEEADISKPSVLLTAFTGTAAFNISGVTLHSLFKLPRNLKPPFQGLGNKLDEVRADLSNAEILVIDEVSMVSKYLFAYVDMRLKQIKGNQRPFGGMSVLAVGDFYQLPPVRQSKPLCVYDPTRIDLWRDQFQIITLTEIMRQKDDVAFAETLNRIRVKEKDDVLSGQDKALLSQAVTVPALCPKDILHIFATNKQVDAHNSTTLALFHSDIMKIDAHDYKKDPKTGRMAKQATPFHGNNRELADSLKLAIGARVMLTRNVNVQSGLCNGTFACIAEIVISDDGPHVSKLGLELDVSRNPNNVSAADNIVYIERDEENLKQRGVVRRQFPLKLAFACTIHKVQGMTKSSAAVSLKHIFEPGMAYVALSRVTSLSGLHILDLDEKKIYANPEVLTGLASMTEASLQHIMPLFHISVTLNRQDVLTVIHHNTEGLPAHVADIKSHHELCLADVLCLTETHLQGSFVSENIHLEGYTLFHRNRNVSYTNCPHISNKNGGGVAIYVRNHIRVSEKRYIQNATDIEFTVIKLEAPFIALIAAVYRPPSYSVHLFLKNLQSLLDSLEVMDHHPIIVCGDFNENLLSGANKPIYELFRAKGYAQLITAATTDKNTLLDSIYISRPQRCLHSGVLQSYYSYHNPVYCTLTSENV
uniref:ATP-dependent DNA helicase n=2 Tax=Gadus morhua TaxID=8049 RepID=A0A8C5FK64_GADMO